MDLGKALIALVILIFSAIVHEVMHGVVAGYFGDSTAKDEGRITLNPVPHIDPFGSILLPLILLVAGSPVILGSAKPVPVNYAHMRRPRMGMVAVSLAGPFSNFALAGLCALPLSFGLANAVAAPILVQAVLINLVLGVFNILPIPPLDGSKVIAAFAPREWMYRMLSWERFGFILIIIFLYTGLLNTVLYPVVVWFAKIFGLAG